MGKFISAWFLSSLGKYDGDKGTFNMTTENILSKRHVDFDDFAEQLRKIYEDYDAEGYEVVNVTPIQIGQTEVSGGKTRDLLVKSTTLSDVGFSITRGAVVVGKKRD